MREDRRFMEAGCGAASEKLHCAVVGGRGERDREVERELWVDMVAWTGIWIVRERRREDKL